MSIKQAITFAALASLVALIAFAVIGNLGATLQTTFHPVGTASENADVNPGWRTPLLSTHYAPVVPTPGWRTPQTSNYPGYNPVPAPGWRTPPMSKYYPPFIPTPGWRTPPTSNYVQ